MTINRKKIVCWAGWYRENTNDYKAIFIQKHLELISEMADLYCFHISHKKNLYCFKKYILKEPFGEVTIYNIPNFFLFKWMGYFLIPFIESIKAKRKFGKIDIFHLHISYPFAAFTFLLDLFKIEKWILTEHWSGYTYTDNQFSKLNFILKKLIYWRLKKFQKISLVSEFLKNQFVLRFPFAKNKVYLSYNVIKFPESIHTIQKKLKSQPFQLLTVSNLIDYPKNISFLIQVIHHLSQTLPDIQLHIYGDGKDKDKLIALSERLKVLNKNVFFQGKIENEKIIKLYRHYHAFILLSQFETFSVVTAEAIANGLPVIVSKCGGVEDYVNENNGIIVPINDLNATQKAILMVYSNYEKFNPEKVQSTIVEKFSKDNIKNQFQFLLS